MFVPILINDIVSVLYLQCLTHSRSERPFCARLFFVVDQWGHLIFHLR